MSKPTKKKTTPRPATAREREAADRIFNLLLTANMITKNVCRIEHPTSGEYLLACHLDYLKSGIITALEGTSIGDHIGKLRHRYCLSNAKVPRGTKKASTTTKSKNKRRK